MKNMSCKIGYQFKKLGICSEDLKYLVPTKLDLMKIMSIAVKEQVMHSKPKAKTTLRTN
jgi:hypothetical protein